MDPIKDATKLKTQFQVTMQTATSLIDVVMKNAEWSYFRNQLEPLKDAMKHVQDAVTTSTFFGEFMAQKKSDVEKTYG